MESKDRDSNCYVHLGRFGDLMILIPGWKEEFERTGRKPVVMVAAEFASIFDGISYVQPWVEPLQFCADARRAKAMAEKHFEKVIFPRWWDIGSAPPITPNSDTAKVTFLGREFVVEDGGGHQASQWRAAGFDEDGLTTWPLVFDRRDLRREASLAKTVFKTTKPKLLINLHAASVPFAAVPELLNGINKLRSRFEFVDMTKFRAERLYDLVGLLDRAAALLTVDTSTLHLAFASQIPYVALLVDGFRGSIPKGNCVMAARYSEVPQAVNRISAALSSVMYRPAQTNSLVCAV